MEIKWVDTHCHLQLLNKNLDENHFKNIEFLVIPGVDVESSSKAKEISSSLEVESYWSAGLHPHDAKLLDTQRHDLEKLFVEADLIGETGLDFYRNLSTKEEQRENFLFHLEFSKQLNKPNGFDKFVAVSIGGGFGGKETQSFLFAAITSIAAKKLSKPVKLRVDRDDDMIMTGKRHDFYLIMK